MDQYLFTLKNANAASVNFLKIDVRTALTFSHIALTTADPARKLRTSRAARRAYESIIRLGRNVDLKPSDSKFLRDHMELLRADLVRLGEIL